MHAEKITKLELWGTLVTPIESIAVVTGQIQGTVEWQIMWNNRQRVLRVCFGKDIMHQRVFWVAKYCIKLVFIHGRGGERR